MSRRVRRLAVMLACGVLAIAVGCSKQTAGHREGLIAVASPAIPATVQEVTNPLRGQYEDVNSLFRQGNPAQRR